MKYTTQSLADLFAQLVAGRLVKHNADIRFLNEHPAFAAKIHTSTGRRREWDDIALCEVDELLITRANDLADSLMKRNPSIICLPPPADKYLAHGICANVAVSVYSCYPYSFEIEAELPVIWHVVNLYYL